MFSLNPRAAPGARRDESRAGKSVSQGDASDGDGAFSAATGAADADALPSAGTARLLEAQPSSRCPTTLLRTSVPSFFRKSARAPACHASMGMYPSYPAGTRLANRQSWATCQGRDIWVRQARGGGGGRRRRRRRASPCLTKTASTERTLSRSHRSATGARPPRIVAADSRASPDLPRPWMLSAVMVASTSKAPVGS